MILTNEQAYPNGYTQSTKWQDMPGLSLTAEASGVISYLMCRFFLTLTPKRIAYFRLLVDGIQFRSSTWTVTSDGGIIDVDLSKTFYDLTTAEHEFKYQWRITGGLAALHKGVYIALNTGYY